MTEMVAVCMAFVKNIKKKHVPFGEGGNRESRENEKKRSPNVSEIFAKYFY